MYFKIEYGRVIKDSHGYDTIVDVQHAGFGVSDSNAESVTRKFSELFPDCVLLHVHAEDRRIAQRRRTGRGGSDRRKGFISDLATPANSDHAHAAA